MWDGCGDVHASLQDIGLTHMGWWALQRDSRRMIERACLNKALWSRDGAQQSVRRLNDPDLRAYPCPFAHGRPHWHVGHFPDMDAVAAMQRALRDMKGYLDPVTQEAP